MGIFDRWSSPSTPDKFARLVIRELKANAVDESIQYNPEDFSIRVGTDPGNLFFLSSLHREYLAADPATKWEMLRAFVQSVIAPPQIPGDFAQARANLLPKVRSGSYHDLLRLQLQLGDQAAPACTTQALTDYLSVELAYDLPQKSGMVQDAHLAQWGVSFEDAFMIARDNLLAMSTKFLQQFPGVHFGDWQDSYAPSRLVLRDVIRQLDVKGDPVAMVPHRDALIITGSEDEVGLRFVANGASNLLSDPEWLSGIALRLNGTTWLPFMPPAEHPAYPILQHLRVGTMAIEYRRQHDLLEALVNRDKEDWVVADTKLMKDESTGECSTVAIWTRDVPTLLPKTDKVALIAAGSRSHEPLLTRWGPLAQVAGDLMEPMDLRPARYRVRCFPSDAQLQELQDLNSSDNSAQPPDPLDC